MFVVEVLVATFLAVAAALATGFTVLAVYEVRQAQGGRLTISEQVWSFVRRWPPALFLAGIAAGTVVGAGVWLMVGVLLGHLFTV